MRLEDHKESFKEHKEAVFEWAVEVKGIENSQRIIGLHASRGIIDLRSICLLQQKKIGPGKQINHCWFKSKRVFEKLPEFDNKKNILDDIIELETLCEKLSYGSKKSKDEIIRALDLFKKLETRLKGEIKNEE